MRSGTWPWIDARDGIDGEGGFACDRCGEFSDGKSISQARVSRENRAIKGRLSQPVYSGRELTAGRAHESAKAYSSDFRRNPARILGGYSVGNVSGEREIKE